MLHRLDVPFLVALSPKQGGPFGAVGVADFLASLRDTPLLDVENGVALSLVKGG